MYPPWKQIYIIHAWVFKLKLCFSVSVAAFFRYLTRSDKTARSVDIRVLHQSSDFLVVDKCFDVLINSDDPGVKVTFDRFILR